MITTATLKSGIRLVTESMPEVASLCVGVWVGTGSRDETPEQSGISHFLEHLLFKGTPERTAREIAEEIDAVGGDMNAYTTKEYTTFYVRALAEHVELGLDILCDILVRPALRPEEVDAERQVILEEVLMHRDEPADVVQELFAAAMFPAHPLGREVLGEPDVITKVTVPAIRSFFDAHYLPGNMVIAAAGDLDHERLAAGIEARFAGRSGGSRPLAKRRRRSRSPSWSSRATPSRLSWSSACGRPTATRRRALPSPCSTTFLAGACRAAFSKRSGKPGASPIRSARIAAPMRTRGPWRSRSAPRPRTPKKCSSFSTKSSTASPPKG